VLLTLVGRSYCHLCDDMRERVVAAILLLPDAVKLSITLEEIDLDDMPQLEQRYGEWVPVLVAGGAESGSEICHYHFDQDRWQRALETGRSTTS